ncbi:tRNA (adenosine(37)-N6)-dimethylallyltransferase MiaA [Conchiformibius kuhniae]|uniref:tRNA dimethylallyltransferase n=1 Tax=Conchiformibius kuhniae TaxID=211502 RepID=A0A8T9MTQ6_9NEIS|nr:tRNA (adenosine(37)-N6)-dimethylallyltransferase MiaA [Conchiformibius kuhniae]
MTPAPPRAFALLGPTASGKTALALHLSQHFPCEIISLDSALVYRGMDIGTAKPTPAERAAVPHHLIDIIDPLHSYSAADFVSDCLRLADEIRQRGRIPLIVGGTMMYFQSLTQGLNNLPPADAAVRAELNALKQQHGLSFLYNQLQEIDPDTAARLAPADSQRIERALEVWRLTGKPLSRHLAEQPAAPALALHTLALVPDHRAELHRRIAERFEAMLAQGLADEVAELRARYPELHQELPSMRCTGYRQTWDFLDGRITYPQLREHGTAATRQLAKRQLTWLRRLPADTVLDPCALSAADLERAARDALARFQAA